MQTIASRRLLGATLLVGVTLTMPAAPAVAGDSGATATTGCVSNAEYAKLANGQRVGYIRRVAGDDAQISMRRWASGANRYQERRYDMCTPTDSAHDTLTTRFMWYRSAWRAYLVDTRLGPED